MAEAAAGEEAGGKHPLEHRWTLWFDNPNGRVNNKTWGQTLRSVYTFGTVEEFWCLFNNIIPPSALMHGADFHVFKHGVEPKWEDPICASGGKWTCPVPRGQDSKSHLDALWLHVLLALIGEQFTDGDDICGAVVSVRKSQDRVALWTKTSSNEAVQMSIGKELKTICGMGEISRIGYLVHQDAIKLDRKAKDRYTC